MYTTLKEKIINSGLVDISKILFINIDTTYFNDQKQVVKRIHSEFTNFFEERFWGDSIIRYEYDAQGNCTTQTEEDGEGNIWSRIQRLYNLQGKLIVENLCWGNKSTFTTDAIITFAYDKKERVIEQTRMENGKLESISKYSYEKNKERCVTRNRAYRFLEESYTIFDEQGREIECYCSGDWIDPEKRIFTTYEKNKIIKRFTYPSGMGEPFDSVTLLDDKGRTTETYIESENGEISNHCILKCDDEKQVTYGKGPANSYFRNTEHGSLIFHEKGENYKQQVIIDYSLE